MRGKDACQLFPSETPLAREARELLHANNLLYTVPHSATNGCCKVSAHLTQHNRKGVWATSLVGSPRSNLGTIQRSQDCLPAAVCPSPKVSQAQTTQMDAGNEQLDDNNLLALLYKGLGDIPLGHPYPQPSPLTPKPQRQWPLTWSHPSNKTSGKMARRTERYCSWKRAGWARSGVKSSERPRLGAEHL